MAQSLPLAVQSVPGHPAKFRTGTVLTVSPLTVDIQGTVFTNCGVLGWYIPAVGDLVAVAGQSSLNQDQSSWLVLGDIQPASAPPTSNGSLRTLLLASCTADLPLTVTPQIMASMQIGPVNVPFDSQYELITVVDFTSVGTLDGTGVGETRLDTVALPGQNIYSAGLIAGPRATTVQVHAGPLLAGDHTFQLFAYRVGGADGNLQARAIHSQMSLKIFG